MPVFYLFYKEERAIVYIIYIEYDLKKKKDIYYSEDKGAAQEKFNDLLKNCVLNAYISISNQENNSSLLSKEFKNLSISNQDRILFRSKEYLIYKDKKGRIIGNVSFVNDFNKTYIERVVMEVI